MTGIDAAADRAPRPAPMRPRWRMPASRGGVAGLVVLLIVAAFLAVQFGRQIWVNQDMGRQAAEIRAQIAATEAENELLEAELRYLRSEAYISAEARRLANLGEAGDQVLIIPAGAEAPLPEELAAAEAPPPLLDQWWALFFGPPGG